MYLQQIMPHKRLHPQSQKRKQHKAAQNMSKANNKDTKTTPLTSLWCLITNSDHIPYPTPMPHFRPRTHWAINISTENTLKVKPAEVHQEPNTQS